MRGPYLTIADEKKPLFGRYFWITFIAPTSIFWFFLIPIFFGGPSVRSPVSKAKADMRSLATAIESYIVDQNRYPPATLGYLAPSVLTTPVAYVTVSSLQDPHKNLRYFCTEGAFSHWRKRLFPIEFIILVSVLGIMSLPCTIISLTLDATHKLRDRFKEYLRLSMPLVAWGVLIYVVVLLPDAIDGRRVRRICGPGEAPPTWSEPENWFHYQNLINVPDSPELTSDVRSHAWVLSSVGPDGDNDLKLSDLEETSYSGASFYDPRNGTRSSGDIIRTGKGQLN